MAKFETECPNCGHESEIEVNGISELPKTIMCSECGQGYVKDSVPAK